MKIENKQLLKTLLSIRANNVFYYENLQNYLTFRPKNCYCKCLIECNTELALMKTLKVLNNRKTHNLNFTQPPIKHFILGNGSNSIVKNFYDGYIIKLGKNFKKIKKLRSDSEHIYLEVGAGTNLFVLQEYLKNKNIGGLEWAYGIPGTVGGATVMNAGAFGEEIGRFIDKVKIIKNGRFIWMKNFEFTYRNSSLKENGDIITAVVLKLFKSSRSIIEQKQKEFLTKRQMAQPYNFASAGSVFKRMIKNGEIIYPAKLIDNLGLKGATIREAKVSTKHAGFIVNAGSATGQDYLELVELIEERVKKEYNISLQREVEILE